MAASDAKDALVFAFAFASAAWRRRGHWTRDGSRCARCGMEADFESGDAHASECPADAVVDVMES